MSGKIFVDQSQYRNIIKNAWNVRFDVEECFPKELSYWIKYHATVVGVPTTYISWPLLITASYCAQHSFVQVNDIHQEPTILYGLVVGRSGNY